MFCANRLFAGSGDWVMAGPFRWPLATRWLMRLTNEGRSRLQSWLYMTLRGSGL